MIWRQLLSILLLPFTVVVVVPAALLGSNRTPDLLLAPATAFLASLASVLLFAAGLGLFAWTIVLFARVGHGTLAPWDPTRRLVTVGPYRRVRNPMISGVALMLLGEALFFRSAVLGSWALAFIIVNHLYFLLSEEPGLRRRFGNDYEVYRKRVPRWLPRLRTAAARSDRRAERSPD